MPRYLIAIMVSLFISAQALGQNGLPLAAHIQAELMPSLMYMVGVNGVGLGACNPNTGEAVTDKSAPFIYCIIVTTDSEETAQALRVLLPTGYQVRGVYIHVETIGAVLAQNASVPTQAAAPASTEAPTQNAALERYIISIEMDADADAFETAICALSNSHGNGDCVVLKLIGTAALSLNAEGVELARKIPSVVSIETEQVMHTQTEASCLRTMSNE